MELYKLCRSPQGKEFQGGDVSQLDAVFYALTGRLSASSMTANGGQNGVQVSARLTQPSKAGQHFQAIIE